MSASGSTAGGVHTWKASSDETDGAFILFEDVMTQGKTTPLHAHANEDETLYVLDGEILVHIDGNEYSVGTRGVAIAPRGVPHAFLVTSPTACVVNLQTPGTAEAFYRGASEPATDDTDPSDRVDSARVREAAERFGDVQLLGPPPFAAPEARGKDRSSIAPT